MEFTIYTCNETITVTGLRRFNMALKSIDATINEIVARYPRKVFSNGRRGCKSKGPYWHTKWLYNERYSWYPDLDNK